MNTPKRIRVVVPPKKHGKPWEVTSQGRVVDVAKREAEEKHLAKHQKKMRRKEKDPLDDARFGTWDDVKEQWLFRDSLKWITLACIGFSALLYVVLKCV